MKKWVVDRSSIHGRGLFATKGLKAGELLGTCRSKKVRKPGPYTLTTAEGAFDITCDFRYINHSDDPNVAYYDDLTVMTLRSIRRGEELTHDYTAKD